MASSASSSATPAETFTLTYSEAVENHAGMQCIGERAAEGLNADDIQKLLYSLSRLALLRDSSIEIHHLTELAEKDLPDEKLEPACLIVVRKGVDILLKSREQSQKLSADVMLREHQRLTYDTKALMGRGKRRRVMNKRARSNICVADTAQVANYEEGKGTIIAFKDLPATSALREALGELLPKLRGLKAEGNRYERVKKKQYISGHGDLERSIVVAARLGADMPFYYQWYLRSEPVGRRLEIMLHHGDIYFMSHKAVGNDWLKRSIPTLRHSAGEEAVRLFDAAQRRKAAKREEVSEDSDETESDDD